MSQNIKNSLIIPKFPKFHPSLVYSQFSIHSSAEILQNTILFSVGPHERICKSTLPQFIRQLPLSDDQQLVFYLLILQNLRAQFYIEQQIIKWLSSDTHGFALFSKQLIRASNNEQLIIEHAAIINHYKSISCSLFKKKELSSIVSTYTTIKEIEQFHQKWVIASQFMNTRCFGYTKESILVPGMDYFNYDPGCLTIKTKFVNYNHIEEILNNHEQPKKISKNSMQSKQQQKIQKGYLSRYENQFQVEGGQQEQQTKLYVGIQVTDRILKGEQITFCYGELSNHDLFKFYGYAVRENVYDNVEIYVKNYKSQKMIYFSAVERGTTKFKLYFDQLNTELIKHWSKIFSSLLKNDSVELLIWSMKVNLPPQISKQNEEKHKFEAGLQYLKTLQAQQHRIYLNQILLMEQMKILQ